MTFREEFKEALLADLAAWRDTPPKPEPKVRVLKFKGERQLQQGVEAMLEKGWEIQGQTARKQVYSALTGVWTRKQIHTVTFVKK